MHTVLSLIVALLAASIAPLPAAAQDASAIVWCLDEARGIVGRKPAWRCDGSVVDETEAVRIRAQRIRRIQGRIREPEPLFEGTRLAGSGTGFFVSAEGHLLTNYHVIDDCTGISVTPAGGAALISAVIAADRAKDLALLVAPIDPDGVAVFREQPPVAPGEKLAVVGYPLHGKVAIRPILESGRMYDGRARLGADRFAMRIDIRRGNSGGPALDRAGRVVGVVVAKINTPQVYAATGRLIRDVGIAIRPSVALQFLRREDVPLADAAGTKKLSDDDLFDLAHRFVGQVGCWR
jgi:S1-C subfamily serine protease